MPYDATTREFWLDENEKAWVATHEAEWKQCMDYAAGDTSILSLRVRDAMMRQWAVEYQPAIHDPGKVNTNRIDGKDYKSLRLWRCWNKEKATDTIYFVDGLRKGHRIYEKVDVSPEDIRFTEPSLHRGIKHGNMHVAYGGNWTRA